MTPIERKARELLAAEYAKEGIAKVDADSFDADRAAIRALITALTPPAGGLPELPEPVAVIYPDSGLRNDEHALALWQAHQYDTGGEPLFSADQLHSYSYARAIAAARVGDAPDEKGEFYVTDGDGGISVASADFKHDVALRVTGDFEDEVQHQHYAEWVAATLNAAVGAAAPQVALNRGGD